MHVANVLNPWGDRGDGGLTDAQLLSLNSREAIKARGGRKIRYFPDDSAFEGGATDVFGEGGTMQRDPSSERLHLKYPTAVVSLCMVGMECLDKTPTGTVFNSSGKVGYECVDVNECTVQDVHPCEMGFVCKNMNPLNNPEIDPWTRSRAGFNCEDFNECLLHKTNACSENSVCMNSYGGYECKCDAGYTFEEGSQYLCVNDDDSAAKENVWEKMLDTDYPEVESDLRVCEASGGKDINSARSEDVERLNACKQECVDETLCIGLVATPYGTKLKRSSSTVSVVESGYFYYALRRP
jgi:hypothetical protein